jgi:hypothetical protein
MSTPAERPQRKTLQRRRITVIRRRKRRPRRNAARKRRRKTAATFRVSATFLEALQRARMRTPPVMRKNDVPTLPVASPLRLRIPQLPQNTPLLINLVSEESEDSDELYGPDSDEVCWVPFTSALEHNMTEILNNL